MCGIAGVYCFGGNAGQYRKELALSVRSLDSRGPDDNGIYIDRNVGFGHTRLSIINTSKSGAQPFIDNSGNYVLVYNGEFYNYKEFRRELLNDGVNFKSDSDTEVLLYLLIKYGANAIGKINGCFAFAFYDLKKNECIIARDRIGINPLVYYKDRDKIIFASEMKAIIVFGIDKKLDHEVVKTYFQLNYIPTNQSILKNIFKLHPGTYMVVNQSGIERFAYYKIPQYTENSKSKDSYKTACGKLFELMNDSVERRLVSDVPIGCFLSGGIDSSVITALASQHTKNLNTFSIGFSDNEYFDETPYAEMVAKRYNTNHTVFKVSNDDLLNNLFFTLDYIDEPFADSSALAVNILSKLTRTKAKVALSGDGADEMFGGYNKHSAHLKVINSGIIGKMTAGMDFLWKLFPKSRNSKTANFFRQLNRFSSGYKLSPQERYWYWASIGNETYTGDLLRIGVNDDRFTCLKNENFDKNIDFNEMNDILYTDMHLVLQGDMLVKADLMSMSNCLEVRTPFLDHHVVNYVFTLPAEYKIDNNCRKKILKDTFREYIPEEILTHPKHGFEVPLLDWFRNDLQYIINEDLLSESFIKEQEIFNYASIKKLKNKLKTNNPEDSASKIWALVVFQYWWKKYFNN